MKFTQKANTPYLYTNIRALCAAKGLSIAELERSAGLGNGVVRKWEAASPTLRSVVMVAECLGTTVDALIQPRET
ncbi:MAG: helix-turn-helix transcriptional regulator [Oscillibacter sp.]|nr:helix-turn-helix transcriptional regulator [Oscillibacter sp.]MBQ9616914.1 helix-turn-helix transcriptional regulator [Oscillibacter sp.]